MSFRRSERRVRFPRAGRRSEIRRTERRRGCRRQPPQRLPEASPSQRSNRVLGVAQPVGIREANGFGNEWKPGGLPEPNPTEPAGETGFAAHPIRLISRSPLSRGENA